MGQSPFFPSVDVVRLPLKLDTINGDYWIEVKRELSWKEEQRYRKAGVPFVSRNTSLDEETPDVRMGLDVPAMTLERILVYLQDWNLVDGNGKVPKITRSVVEQLRPDVLTAIDTAIDKHVEAQAEEKKALSGSGTPAPVS